MKQQEKKRGRPRNPNGKTVSFGFRMTAGDMEILTKLSESQGKSKGSLIVEGIVLLLEKYGGYE